MLSAKLEDMINEQIKYEFYSAYLYLEMSTWLAARNLNGFATWFRVQAQEEQDHALLLLDYLNKVGATVQLRAIDAPGGVYTSPLDVAQQTLEHEQTVTGRIYDIMTAAQDERDYKTIQFLQWFVTEQTEEEENATGIIEKLKISGNSEGGVLFLDKELSTRVYAPPSLVV